jgi:hypothetical protein
MNGLQPAVRHPSTGTLLRQLDGELSPQGERRVAAHLEQCESCRERAAELRGASEATARHVRALPDGAGAAAVARARVLAGVRVARARQVPARRGRLGWAAAAGVGGLILLSFGVDPVRAWVLTRLGVTPEAGVIRAERVVELPAARVGVEGSVVGFRPAGSVFELQLQSAQPTGDLLLRVRPGERATAQAIDSGGESFLLLPAGLLIENEPGSTASYRVMLPPTVKTILLRIGDAPARVLPVESEEGSWSVSLPLGGG